MEISNLGIFFRGVLMGVAEIVPGISGGTVAFITGIYPKLVSTLLFSTNLYEEHHGQTDLFLFLALQDFYGSRAPS